MEHHAYYIEGGTALFEHYKHELRPFIAQCYDKFGVNDARELKGRAALKHAGGAVFFIAASSITSEAQQALLKLFEEPQQGVTLVFLLPHGMLLPTLRSRMLEYPKIQITNDKSQTISKFLIANQKERSDFITKLLKDEDGAKERVRDFVNALEVALAKDVKKNKQGLADIATVRDYLGDRAPSMKMLLEHLALSLPSF